MKQKEKEDYVCLLRNSLYGLKQSCIQWYKRFDSFVLGFFTYSFGSSFCFYKLSTFSAQISKKTSATDICLALNNMVRTCQWLPTSDWTLEDWMHKMRFQLLRSNEPIPSSSFSRPYLVLCFGQPLWPISSKQRYLDPIRDASDFSDCNIYKLLSPRVS